MTTDALVDFDRWFAVSKYTQIVLPDDRTRQIALDGWNAAIDALTGETPCRAGGDAEVAK